MKVVLATGIYPPDIGGPATYVRELARELARQGIGVCVVTYAREKSETEWDVICISKFGGPLLRWWRYARALKKHAADAEVVIAFSLVSVGVPLWLSGLRKPFDKAQGKPKLILRLGGDFLWERYTDLGGGLGLREWYESRFWQIVGSLARWLAGSLLQTFDHVVFSTRFQEEIYEKHYRGLPEHLVIENALSAPTPGPSPAAAARPDAVGRGEGRTKHAPFRLLFMGRFVAFKNLPSLLRAMTELPGITLTLVGEGPLRHLLEGNVLGLHLRDRVTFHPKATPDERNEYFHSHDLLVIPSVTEISPNVALEARAAGLPVLLTEETGLSERLRQGMVVRKLRTPEHIRDAIREVVATYEHVVQEAARAPTNRPWGKVREEYFRLFSSLINPHPDPLPSKGESGSLL
ncbi:glycosyltransferase family 4 protein [Candidatus Peregrinibacteria bacterium]|nr:glycosyltransferase family 4 protein [Candidatus Peregrinibacteria bacterium]